MLDVSSSYEQVGRTDQKRRTRDQLVAAARGLIAEHGVAPTVEEAALAASISRTTAYRYFPNQRALLVAAHPEVAATSLVSAGVGSSVEERLDVAVKAFTDLVLDTEVQQRTMLLLSLQGGSSADLPLRQGRAIGWFTDALAPLREQLGDEALHLLAVAIRSAVGIESMVWLLDVVGLSRDQAARLVQWSARAMLREVLSSGPPAP